MGMLRWAAICATGSMLVALGPMAHAGEGAIVPVDRALCNDMKAHHVIKAGAVVGCERLSLVRFSYLGFDGADHDDGEIMVMDAAAESVLRIFAKLREIRFPIAKAKLINAYEGSDDASIADDNTAAFNSRNVAGTNSLSLHAYGLAIDLNPLENPYVQHSGEKLIFSPPAGARFTNRFKGQPDEQLRRGLAEAAIDVFADEGFVIWGGTWKTSIDYQHFQVSRGFAEQLARLAPAQAKTVFAQHVERYRACRRKGGAEGGRASCIASSGN
jgi:D-alanyl-D-alanine carboxypeptidase-like protein